MDRKLKRANLTKQTFGIFYLKIRFIHSQVNYICNAL